MDRIDNHWRHGKQHWEYGNTPPVQAGSSGVRFDLVVIQNEVGPEVTATLIDSTDFVHRLKERLPVELNLKTGMATTRFGPVLFLLWWVPPIENGEPFAMYEQVMNPVHPGTLDLLCRAARQTHLHVVVLGPGGKLIDFLEYENNFGFEELVPVIEATKHKYPQIDFASARREYERTSDLVQLFAMA